MDTIKLTLDTNCLINTFCLDTTTATDRQDLKEIFILCTDKRIKIRVDIALTTAVEQDLAKDNDRSRQDARMQLLQGFHVIGTLRPKNLKATQEELRRVLFPGKHTLKDRDRLDIRHLAIHTLGKRDIFVTSDQNFTKKVKSCELEEQGVVVLNPKECRRLLEKVIYNDSVSSIRPEVAPRYSSKALRGAVSFDYSNNNGSYIIGNGMFSFETKWNKASNRSIHCCSDPPSIEGLALAKGVTLIDEVTSTSKYDFSSRCRTINLDHNKPLLILKNKSGFYAAILVEHIQDDTRSYPQDKLEFQYVIQKNGTDDFSKE